MNQEPVPDFIIIDDDGVNNIICTKIIELTIKGASVRTFTDPEKGLDHILSTYSVAGAKNAILFLDINMPSLTGWEVLDEIAKFPDHVRQHGKIFMLSSSVDPADRERADNCPLVSGYISKSLSQAKLSALFPEYAAH